MASIPLPGFRADPEQKPERPAPIRLPPQERRYGALRVRRSLYPMDTDTSSQKKPVPYERYGLSIHLSTQLLRIAGILAAEVGIVGNFILRDRPNDAIAGRID